MATFQWNKLFTKGISNSNSRDSMASILQQTSSTLPSWDDLKEKIITTDVGQKVVEQESLRNVGAGLPHTDAKLRLFGTKDEPRVTFYRDTAAWCPYCQKVWILLEEKQIPYRVEKINMRSYGDKPAEFLRMVPNGLLPAIILDGKTQTDSLPIMLNLDRTFNGPKHKSMFPNDSSPEYERAQKLMRLERILFSSWCTLVFRPSTSREIKSFEDDLDIVNQELLVTSSPWFLNEFSIVDLTYITHVERMCASVAYWSGIKLRGSGRWPAIEKWMDAFETMPSYLATKSDYYTHVMDIPPQYGPGYRIRSTQAVQMSQQIDGTDGSWKLPLPPFNPSQDIEPIYPSLDPGEVNSRHEALYKLIQNYKAVINFALRGAGSPGVKQFQAPLADPYATPNLSLYDDMDICLRQIATALYEGYTQVPPLTVPSATAESGNTAEVRQGLIDSLKYLQLRIGVPRDMSYPAARQFRAHLTWMIDQLG